MGSEGCEGGIGGRTKGERGANKGEPLKGAKPTETTAASVKEKREFSL